VGGQLDSPAALDPGNIPVPILRDVLRAAGPIWTGVENRPHRDLVPGPSEPLRVTVPTTLSRPNWLLDKDIH